MRLLYHIFPAFYNNIMNSQNNNNSNVGSDGNEVVNDLRWILQSFEMVETNIYGLRLALSDRINRLSGVLPVPPTHTCNPQCYPPLSSTRIIPQVSQVHINTAPQRFAHNSQRLARPMNNSVHVGTSSSSVEFIGERAFKRPRRDFTNNVATSFAAIPNIGPSSNVPVCVYNRRSAVTLCTTAVSTPRISISSHSTSGDGRNRELAHLLRKAE